MIADRPHLSTEQGFSLVEAIVGAMISALIAGAVAMGLVESNDSSLATQRQTQLVSVLEARIEWIHQLLAQEYTTNGFGVIALSTNPPKGKDNSLPVDPTDPNDFVVHHNESYKTEAGKKTWEGFLIEKNYNNTEKGVISGASATEGEQLDVDANNGKIPGENFVDLTTEKTYTTEKEAAGSGHPYAVVNTYVTLDPEDVSEVTGGCNTTAGTESTAEDARRVIVAARYHPAGEGVLADTTPQYVTTLLTNPTPSNQCQTPWFVK
jgi:type II secretory pathway pseudopilin PulG